MSSLRQGVCEHACVLHACAHALPGVQVRLLRQELLQTVATAGAHPHTHRYVLHALKQTFSINTIGVDGVSNQTRTFPLSQFENLQNEVKNLL